MGSGGDLRFFNYQLSTGVDYTGNAVRGSVTSNSARDQTIFIIPGVTFGANTGPAEDDFVRLVATTDGTGTPLAAFVAGTSYAIDAFVTFQDFIFRRTTTGSRTCLLYTSPSPRD